MKLVEELVRRIKRWNLDAPTEEESPRDGLYSHAGETHAALIGLGIGLVAGYLHMPEFLIGGMAASLGLPVGEKILNKFGFNAEGALAEMRREPWYAIAHMAIGFVIAGGPEYTLTLLRSLGL